MSTTAYTSEPASELEHLIADLPGSGLLAFVFGVGWWVAHLTGVTTHLFRGPADRRWWHVELGDDAASWTMDVRVDEITGVRFVRGPYPFPSFPGREALTVEFLELAADGEGRKWEPTYSDAGPANMLHLDFTDPTGRR